MVDMYDDGTINCTGDVKKVIEFLMKGLHAAWNKCDEQRDEANGLRDTLRKFVVKDVELQQRVAELKGENRTMRDIVDERDNEIRELHMEMDQLRARIKKAKKKKR